MLEPAYLILFILLALVAEVMGTVGGFGSSMLFVPIAGYFLDFHSVLGVTALFHVSSNLSKIALFRDGLDKDLLLKMGIPAVIFVAAGAYLSRFLDSRVSEIVLAVFLLVMSTILFFFRDAVIRPGTFNTVAGGVFSGLAAGLVGTGGAIRGMVLAAFNLETQAFITTSAFIDLAVDSGRSVVYSFNGYVHVHDLYLVALLFAVSFIGTYIGKSILKKVSKERFKNIVLTLVFLTALITLVKMLR